MPPKIPVLPAPPLRDNFAPQTDPRSTAIRVDTQTPAPGINWPWQKWFQTLQQSITAQVSSIQGLSFQPFTQAMIPGSLPVSSSGFLILVTDFNHVLMWSGTSWTWGPGEPGSGYIQAFLNAPTGAGWHLCDGATVNRLNANGTITSVTLPNFATASYLKLGTTAAAGPSAGSGTVQDVSAGTPSGTNAAVTSGVESNDQANVAITGATTVAGLNHTHNVPGQTFTGNLMPTHNHGAGSLELQRTQLLAYFRQ